MMGCKNHGKSALIYSVVPIHPVLRQRIKGNSVRYRLKRTNKLIHINIYFDLQFIKWVVTKDDENPEKAKEDNKMHYSRLMASIAQCEWTENKSKLVQDMNRTEAKNYEKLYEKIKLEISQAEEEIRQTKADLVEARKVRRNRMEYDALAKVISKNPDRSTQGRKIEDVKAELDDLKATEDALETKLESRKKQFHVLVQSIHNLQALLDEDNDISFHSSRMKEDANESIEDGIMDTS